MNSNILYDTEYILNEKKNYTKLPDDLEKKYSECYNIIVNSDNYKSIIKLLESMIKIKTNKIHSKIEIDKMKIISLLNKLTDFNYKIIKNDIIKIDYNYELYEYLTNNLFLKIINDDKYFENYFNLALYIIKNKNYYIDEKNNFYILLINYSQDLFNYLLDKENYNNLNNSKNNNVEFYFKKKKNLKGNIKFIVLLFNNNLLPSSIILFIIDNLMDSSEIKIEILCYLLKFIDKKKLDSNYLLNLKNNIDKMCDNSRLKYLFEDSFDDFDKDKKLVNNNDFKIKKDLTIKNDMKLKNVINEYLGHKNLKETYSYLEEFINNYSDFLEDYLYIIFDLIPDQVNIVNNLLLSILNKFKIFNITSLDNIIENLEDITLDYPYSKKYLEDILNLLYKNNFIELDYFNNVSNNLKD